MNPDVELDKCEVLEVENRSYTKKDGTAATYRGVLFRYGGKIFKVALAQKADAASFEKAMAARNPVTLVLEMSTFGDSIEPNFRLLDLAPRK